MARTRSNKRTRWLEAIPVRATAIDARGPAVRGPTAMGALAAGASALGAVAIGRLALGHAKVKRLVIDDLEIRRLRLAENGEAAMAMPAGDARTRALRLLSTQDHATLATSDESGKPWASPLFFVHDEEHNVYWVSPKTAAHSANIRARPEVALVIFVGAPALDALYLDAMAVELEDETEIARAIELLGQKEQPEKFTVKRSDQVTGDAVWRIYKATPGAAFMREDAWEEGQAISRREAVQIG